MEAAMQSATLNTPASGRHYLDVIHCGGCCDACDSGSDALPATDWSGLVAGLAALLVAATLIGLFA
jgi:hypothetical protein